MTFVHDYWHQAAEMTDRVKTPQSIKSALTPMPSSTVCMAGQIPKN